MNLAMPGEVQSAPEKRRVADQIHTEKTSYGMRIALPESLSEDELVRLLMRIPEKAYRLPEGEGIALDFQARACSQDLLIKLLWNVVWKKKIRVLAWLSTDERSLSLFRGSGLLAQVPKPEPPAASSREADAGPPATKFIYGSMRSGRSLEVGGDVVVWGHLHPGAEIAAGGSVMVLGRLQGLVHAGREGREDVCILAGSFETSQVRLANRLCHVADQDPRWGKPILITFGEEGALEIRENGLLMNDDLPESPKPRRSFLPFIGKIIKGGKRKEI